MADPTVWAGHTEVTWVSRGRGTPCDQREGRAQPWFLVANSTRHGAVLDAITAKALCAPAPTWDLLS